MLFPHVNGCAVTISEIGLQFAACSVIAGRKPVRISTLASYQEGSWWKTGSRFIPAEDRAMDALRWAGFHKLAHFLDCRAQVGPAKECGAADESIGPGVRALGRGLEIDASVHADVVARGPSRAARRRPVESWAASRK